MLGFATGGLISSVPTVVGSLPDGSLLVKSQYSGVTHTITPEAFAMMPLDQRNALEQQVRNQALNAQNQAQQDAAEAKRRQQEAEAQQKASDAAQRQQLAVQQQILDAQMQEYQQGQTGADTRASLAGLAAPLTQSQYLQNFVLPAVQIAGGNTVLDASRTPRQQPSLYGPVTQNSAGLLTATRLNPRPTLNTQQALRGPNTRPSLLRLAVR